MRMVAITLLFAATLAGCAGLDTTAATGPCLSDSPECVTERTGMVRSMSTDPGRAWIGQPANASIAASGVRLFAYQNVRDKLSCAELASAVSDLENSKLLLQGGPAPGQSMQRHNDIKAMTDDVRASLTAARQRKCGSGT